MCTFCKVEGLYSLQEGALEVGICSFSRPLDGIELTLHRD